MGERKTALVPVFPVDFQFSQKQQQEIVGATRRYLADQRVAIEGKDIFRAAFLVVTDALRRELDSQGRIVPEPKERISPLVRGGLDKRSQLIEQARGFLAVVRSTSPFHEQYNGALAIPNSLILACNSDLANVALLGTLGNIEQFVNISKARAETIDKLAAAALTQLPQQLQPTSLDRFPTIDERAKMVRNMIASYVLRNTLFPIITTEDLKGMVLASPQTTGEFNQQRFNDLFTLMGLKTQPEVDTLKALFKQTKDIFSKTPPIPQKDLEMESDIFYTYFGRDLLLLHPVLEEERIVISSDKIRPGLPTLWDEGIAIGSLLIPNPERLHQAKRQSGVRGYQWDVGRLAKAIHAWREYDRSKAFNKQKIAKAEARLSQLEAMLEDVLSGKDLPKRAFFVIYEEQIQARREAEVSSKRALETHETIEKYTKKRKTAQDYQKSLANKYGTDLPEQVELLNVLAVRHVEFEISSIRWDRGKPRERFNSQRKVLSFDPFCSKALEDKPKISEPAIPAIIQQLLEQNRRFIDAASSKEISDIEPIYAQLISDYFQALKIWQEGPDMAILPAPIYRWIKTFKGSQEKLKTLESDKNRQQHMRKVVLKFANSRSQLLQACLVSIQEYENLTFKITLKEQQIAAMDQVDPAGFAKGYKWNRRKAQEYFQQSQAAIPNLEGLDRETVIKTADVIKSAIRGCLEDFRVREQFPVITPDKNELKNILQAKMDTLSWEIAEQESAIKDFVKSYQGFEVNKQELVKLYSRLNRHKSVFFGLDKFVNTLNNPLLDWSECKGLPRELMLEALLDRVTLTKALCQVENIDLQSQQTKDYYLQEVRSLFIQTLNRQIDSQQQKLDELKAFKPESILAAKMESLDLALRAGSV